MQQFLIESTYYSFYKTKQESRIAGSKEKNERSALCDGAFFSIVQISDRSMEAKYGMCKKETLLKVLLEANSSFFKHSKRKHYYEDYVSYKTEKGTTQ